MARMSLRLGFQCYAFSTLCFVSIATLRVGYVWFVALVKIALLKGARDIH